MRSKKIRGNTVVIVLAVIAILAVGGILASKMVLPKLFNKALNTAINTSLDQIKKLDFSNAPVKDLSQNFNEANSALLSLSLNKGTLNIDNASSGKNIVGQIKYLGQEPTVTYEIKNLVGVFSVASRDEGGEERNIHFSPDLATSIEAGVGVGIVNLNLRDLNVPKINVSAGAGEVNVIFPQKYSSTAQLAAGAGNLKISVPKGVAQRITFAQGISSSNIKFGPQYEEVNGGFQTLNYANSEVKADISIGQSAGGFDVVTIE